MPIQLSRFEFFLLLKLLFPSAIKQIHISFFCPTRRELTGRLVGPVLLPGWNFFSVSCILSGLTRLPSFYSAVPIILTPGRNDNLGNVLFRVLLVKFIIAGVLGYSILSPTLANVSGIANHASSPSSFKTFMYV